MPALRSSSHPIQLWHARLIAVGATLIIAAFVTDIAYWRTLSSQWETFSIWLITAGLIVAAMSGLTLVLDVLVRGLGPIDKWRFTGLAVAALLSLLNAFIHSRDGYTAVVPQGLGLSASVTVLLLVVGWHRWSLRAPRPFTLPKTESVHP